MEFVSIFVSTNLSMFHLSENKNLVERFIKENLITQGMIVDYAIHD